MRDNVEMPGHLARRFHQIAVALFHSEMERCGVDLTPVQYAALVAISANPGIDQITLAGKIAYDRTTIVGVIDRLTRKELVERKISEIDRRARTLVITSQGARVVEEVGPAVERVQDDLISGLTQTEGDELKSLLLKAINALNERSRAPQRA
ncbi:transcriptional regulator, MarR family [Sphingobium sp. AP50]|uniref:MarR family winged helix-turn-helix transcriptional regulator n=1 Tax=Sphingobium sp. AP50 TaxID=1884369 RepID=UPI0008AC43EE|nr:MarR family transcriptional regulator [Sphingobium sp. AP50]SEK00187.1 transcriptional regulator, MarR family [Sphingobium sp. AP50]